MISLSKIHLTEEKETLFITLYAKALDYRSKHSVLHDKAADDILRLVKYDFSKHSLVGNGIMVIRAGQFDEWIRAFIAKNKNAVVVYLGCGLDTRIKRINPTSSVRWFDVDYPEVIELRKNFFEENDSYTMIASSVTNTNWLEKIPADLPSIIVAEGLLEYLEVEEVKTLLDRITTHFRQGEIIFDVMSPFAIQSGKEKLRETTGAVHKWAVDDIKEVDKLNAALNRKEALPVFKSTYIKNLSIGSRVLYRFMSLIPKFKNMICLLRYEF